MCMNVEPQGVLPKLKPPEVFIWCRKTSDIPSDAAPAADFYLSIDERRRRDRFHFPNDRRDFVAAHDLLRRALSCYTKVNPADWVFTIDRRGKPLVDFPEAYRSCLSFSLSHTRGAVACGVALGDPIGVDIECADRAFSADEIVDRYFSPGEAAWLRDCPLHMRHVHFTELWTLKEAFLKSIGVGISGPVAAASFRLRDPGQILFESPPGFKHALWHFALFELSADIRIAIAVAGRNKPRFTIRTEDSPVPARLLAVSA